MHTAPGAAPLLLTNGAPLKPAQTGLNPVPISAPLLRKDVALPRNLLFLPPPHSCQQDAARRIYGVYKGSAFFLILPWVRKHLIWQKKTTSPQGRFQKCQFQPVSVQSHLGLTTLQFRAELDKINVNKPEYKPAPEPRVFPEGSPAPPLYLNAVFLSGGAPPERGWAAPAVLGHRLLRGCFTQAGSGRANIRDLRPRRVTPIAAIS